MHVGSSQKNFATLFALEHAAQFCREGGLSRALKARHEYRLKSGACGEFAGGSAHEFGDFVANNFDHQLAGLQGLQHVLTHCTVFDAVGKVFGEFVVYVSVNKGTTYVFDGFGYVDVRNFTASRQTVQRGINFFAQGFKHNPGKVRLQRGASGAHLWPK